MKLWKVYAQCVRRAKGTAIEDVTFKKDEAINEAIDDLLYTALDCGEIEIEDDENQDSVDAAISDFCEKAKEKLEKVGVLRCGDYQLEYSEEMPNRPNVC